MLQQTSRQRWRQFPCSCPAQFSCIWCLVGLSSGSSIFVYFGATATRPKRSGFPTLLKWNSELFLLVIYFTQVAPTGCGRGLHYFRHKGSSTCTGGINRNSLLNHSVEELSD